MAKKIEEGEPGAMKEAILSFRENISIIMPGMDEADTMAVLRVVRDPNCLAILPPMEENETRLEELMPLAENLKGEDVAADLDNMEPLTKEQRRQISELFEDMEIMHEHFVCSCSSLGILARSLSS